MMVAQAAKSHKVREVVLHVVFYSLGIILFIFTAFIALISGLLAIVQNNNLRNHWNYYRTSISELFNGIESDINTNVKDEVYDFMPEFSVNLSKATIANNFDGSSLILYDDDEISRAEDIMLNYAGQLRAIKTQDEFDSFISDFDTDLSFSDISSIRFTDDTGIDNLSEYGEELKVFLYQDIANDTNSKVFNQSAVTIAYIIDTDQFEDDYGFPFPTINGLRHGSTITLFLEFTCLSEVEFEDLDIGSSVDLNNLIVGYSHDGYYSDTYDKGLWRHHLNRDECIPHVGIKTYFMSGEAAAPDPPQGTHYYGGPSAKDIGVVANPRLWFKAFRTGMSDELFETIKAVEPE